jgi:hypothetical protein
MKIGQEMWKERVEKSFNTLSKVWLSLNRFSRNSLELHQHFMKNIHAEFHENPKMVQSLLLGFRQTDECGLHVRPFYTS